MISFITSSPVRHVHAAPLEHLLLPLDEADVAGAVGRPHSRSSRLEGVGRLLDVSQPRAPLIA